MFNSFTKVRVDCHLSADLLHCARGSYCNIRLLKHFLDKWADNCDINSLPNYKSHSSRLGFFTSFIILVQCSVANCS
jgi:hypothetical protein